MSSENVTLEAGDYIVIWEIAGENPKVSGTARLPVRGFELKEAGEPSLYLRVTENQRIMSGGSGLIRIAGDVDGVDVDLSKATFTAVSRDESIATAVVQKGSDGVALAVSGGKVGETIIDVTATLDGKTANLEVPATVVEATELERIELSLNPGGSLQVGDTGVVELKAYRMDGQLLPNDQLSVYLESSDARVLRIDGTTYTARGAGAATVTAYVEQGDIKKQATLSVSVGGSAALASVSLDGPGSVSPGGAIQLSVSGRLTSGFAADLSSAEISYKATENAGVIELDEATGAIKGVALGSAKVQATVTLRGVTLTSQEKTILVREGAADDVVIDFAAKLSGKPVDATIATHGWAVNREATAESVLGADAGEFRYQAYGVAARINGIDTKRDADVSFQVLIPGSGDYRLEVAGGQYGAGCVAAVFVDGVYMGNYDFYSQDNILRGEAAKLNSIHLDAGAYPDLPPHIG